MLIHYINYSTYIGSKIFSKLMKGGGVKRWSNEFVEGEWSRVSKLRKDGVFEMSYNLKCRGCSAKSLTANWF